MYNYYSFWSKKLYICVCLCMYVCMYVHSSSWLFRFSILYCYTVNLVLLLSVDVSISCSFVYIVLYIFINTYEWRTYFIIVIRERWFVKYIYIVLLLVLSDTIHLLYSVHVNSTKHSSFLFPQYILSNYLLVCLSFFLTYSSIY